MQPTRRRCSVSVTVLTSRQALQSLLKTSVLCCGHHCVFISGITHGGALLDCVKRSCTLRHVVSLGTVWTVPDRLGPVRHFVLSLMHCALTMVGPWRNWSVQSSVPVRTKT
jgi:hypothetical protein